MKNNQNKWANQVGSGLTYDNTDLGDQFNLTPLNLVDYIDTTPGYTPPINAGGAGNAAVTQPVTTTVSPTTAGGNAAGKSAPAAAITASNNVVIFSVIGFSLIFVGGIIYMVASKKKGNAKGRN